MNSADREEFEAQMRKLCAGLNNPATPERLAAFWTGMQKMSLPQFVRAVDFMLSEDGPDVKFFTVRNLWDAHRALRSRGPDAVKAVDPHEKPLATVPEQLCAYVTLTCRGRLSAAEFQRPFTYLHREWWVEGKRHSECIGVALDRDNGTRLVITVASMLADAAGYARCLRSFLPSAPPPSTVLRVVQVEAPASPLPFTQPWGDEGMPETLR